MRNSNLRLLDISYTDETESGYAYKKQKHNFSPSFGFYSGCFFSWSEHVQTPSIFKSYVLPHTFLWEHQMIIVTSLPKYPGLMPYLTSTAINSFVPFHSFLKFSLTCLFF